MADMVTCCCEQHARQEPRICPLCPTHRQDWYTQRDTQPDTAQPNWDTGAFTLNNWETP